MVDRAAVVVDERHRPEGLAEVEPGAWRWGADRAVTVLDRATGFLLAAVAVVAVVEVEAKEPAEGGRGGRRTVADERAVTVDFARVCALVRVDCVLAGEIPVASDDGGWVGAVGEGLADWDIDLDVGLVSLVVLMAVGLVALGGSAGSLVVLCVGGFRTATVLSRPNTPETGKGLVPAADGFAAAVVLVVVVDDGRPLPAPTVPARVRVRGAMTEPSGFGSLVGDVVPDA